MNAPLIGLIGKMRAGKDTFAARLIAEHGYTRVSFADPVRQAALDLDPIVDATATHGGCEIKFTRLSDLVARFGWEGAKDRQEVRRVLQNYGTGSIRSIDPEFWVRIGMDAAHRLREGGVPVVITDVRFKNEARAISRAGGFLVRIERPGTDTADTHASETELDGFPVDRLVYNGGTVDQLNNLADAVAAAV